jgi:hypothetical protein
MFRIDRREESFRLVKKAILLHPTLRKSKLMSSAVRLIAQTHVSEAHQARNPYVWGAVVFGILLLAVAPALRAERGKPPLFERVMLSPVAIEPLTFEGAPELPDQEAVVRKLSEEATKQARRILVRAHIAGKVDDAVSSSAPIAVTAVLRLPLSLPPKVRGFNASRQTGRFATVTLTIRDTRTGGVLGSGEGASDWNDAFWTSGGPKIKRIKPLDAVLEHFARKTMERAVWDAARRTPAARVLEKP